MEGAVASLAPSLFYKSVSIAAMSTGIAYAEVISSPQNTPAVFLNDEDNTITSTGAVNLTAGGADAVQIVPDYSSNFTNSARISVPTSTSSSGIGVQIDNSLEATGRIINNGTIVVGGLSADRSAEAIGLFFAEDARGSVSNSGGIDVRSNGYTNALTAGVQIGNDLESHFESSGDVVVETIRRSGVAEAFGLLVEGDVEANTSNTGTVTISTRA